MKGHRIEKGRREGWKEGERKDGGRLEREMRG